VGQRSTATIVRAPRRRASCTASSPIARNPRRPRSRPGAGGPVHRVHGHAERFEQRAVDLVHRLRRGCRRWAGQARYSRIRRRWARARRRRSARTGSDGRPGRRGRRSTARPGRSPRVWPAAGGGDNAGQLVSEHQGPVSAASPIPRRRTSAGRSAHPDGAEAYEHSPSVGTGVGSSCISIRPGRAARHSHTSEARGLLGSRSHP